MNNSVCEEFVQYLDKEGALECASAPGHIQTWLDDLNLPDGLASFMMCSWPQADGFIAHIRMNSSAALYADETTALLLKYKFMNAGSAPNGDWFVIDFSSKACIPGFIPLAEWDHQNQKPPNPRKYFQPIARSFESFLYRAVEGRYLPTDSYAAADFNAFLADERSA